MNREMARRVQALRKDYEEVVGRPFEHFFCPILRVDEKTELCEGHITPASLGVSNAWLPQRKDVDNFFGRAVERECRDAVHTVGKPLEEIFFDKALSQSAKPRLECDGIRIPHFFPSAKDAADFAKPNADGDVRVGLRISRQRALELEGRTIQMIVEKDFRPAVTAVILRTAYLSLFKMFGYEYCFSASGQYVADILRRFYEEGVNLKGDDLKKFVDRCFVPMANMVRPLQNSIGLRGTAQDNHLLTVHSQSRLAYAMGVVVNAGGEMFVAFVPGEPAEINVYFSFLCAPPPSLATKVVKFVEQTSTDEKHWEGPSQPTRMEFPPDY